MKAKLPANSPWITSSSIAGSQVTPSRKTARVAALPATYSNRVSGFDR